MDMDCRLFLIKFDDKNPVSDQYIYLAINLPESYSEEGKRASIEFRFPKIEEFPICTAKGIEITYPQIFVVRASKID